MSHPAPSGTPVPGHWDSIPVSTVQMDLSQDSVPFILNSKPTSSDVEHIAFTKGLGGREFSGTPVPTVDATGEFMQCISISKDIGLNIVLYKSKHDDTGIPLNSSPSCSGTIDMPAPACINQNNMHMCLYKHHKFIDYFSHGYMVLNTIMSSNCVYIAYINCVYDETRSQDYIELLVYKFSIDISEVNLHYSIELSRDICEDPEYANYYLYFSLDNKFLIFKAEWNHIYIINLETMERTEFFIPNDRKNNNHQVIYICTDKSQLIVQGDCLQSPTNHPKGVRLMDFSSSIGVVSRGLQAPPLYDKSTPHGTVDTGFLAQGTESYVVWYGYDEFIRIIELNLPDNKSPIMWRDKLIHTITNYQLQTRYFVALPGNYLLYMDKYNKVTMMKINLKKQMFEFVYDIVYPAIGYDDIKLSGDKVLFLNDKFTCTINMTDKSCRVTKNIKTLVK